MTTLPISSSRSKLSIMFYFTLFSLCAATFASVIQTDKPRFALEDAEKHFEDFIKQFDRHYADEDEQKMRLEIFKQNLVKINKKNMDPEELAEFGINNFADMTSDEMKRSTGFIPSMNVTDNIYKCKYQKYVDAITEIPDELDWRKKNVVTSVKNQLHCGSCWAFGTVGNVESMHAIKYNKLIVLSEQQLVDCDQYDLGCGGGRFDLSFGDLVTKGGVMTLQDYPYTGTDGQCTLDKSKFVVKVKDCILYDPKNEENLRNFLATNGPVAIAIDSEDIYHYTGGILTTCTAGRPDHAVLLVGYGTENGIDYWILKNSWGAGFGEQGYFRAKRNINACGLLKSYVATAVIA